MDEANIGTRIGRVTHRIGRLPIVNDFYEQLPGWIWRRSRPARR